MIEFRGHGGKSKTVRTRLPKTAEFEPLRKVKPGSPGDVLLDRARVALGGAIAALGRSSGTGVRPDDLYEVVLDDAAFRANWEGAFGGPDDGRKVFGLLAWTAFFDHEDAWIATPPTEEPRGKRGWTFRREGGGAAAPKARGARTLGAAPGPTVRTFRIGECVEWRGGGFGKVTDGPRPADGRYYIVLNTVVGVPPEEHWVVPRDLTPAPGQC